MERMLLCGVLAALLSVFPVCARQADCLAVAVPDSVAVSAADSQKILEILDRAAEAVNYQTTVIAALSSRVKSLESDLRSLSLSSPSSDGGDNSGLERKIEELEKRLDKLSGFTFYSYNQPSVAGLEKKIDALEERLDKLSGTPSYVYTQPSVAGLEKKIEALEIRVDKLSGSTSYSYNQPSVAGLERKINALEEKVDRISGNSYGSYGTSISSLKSDLNSLERRVGSLESKISSIEYKLR